jgi:uncharacterized protein (TIGR03435 family)
MTTSTRARVPGTRVLVAAVLAVSIAVIVDNLDSGVRAQTSVSAPAKVEVASIRRNKDVEGARAAAPAGTPIAPARLQVRPGGRLAATGISTLELIREGYGYVTRAASDITGPGWLDIERFDVAIKADRSGFGPGQPWGLLPQDAAEVVREFLADRFKLKLRTERKERAIYELRMARTDRKLGPGLTTSDGTCVGIYAPPGPEPRCPFVLGGGRGFQTGHVTMPELAMFFSAFPAVNTTVIDRTALPGAFDVKMTAFIGAGVGTAAADAPADDRPQMFTAVQDMLGLKLERAGGLVEVLVVERVERPSEN